MTFYKNSDIIKEEGEFEMNIKARLKVLGITLGTMAEELEVTRPTLDNYIAAFEENKVLPKEKYQIAFERLFNDGVETKEDFMDILSNIHELIERDKSYGVLEYSAKHTDLMNSIFKTMKEDFRSEDFDESIYIFINMLVNSYKQVDLFKLFAQYFVILNGQEEIDPNNERQKIFLSNAYKLFGGMKENELTFDDYYYEKYLNRVSEVKSDIDIKKNALKKKIEEKVNEEIKKKLSLGYEVDDINIDELIKNINI